eukprot:3337517-Rhodomonas_salina.3
MSGTDLGALLPGVDTARGRHQASQRPGQPATSRRVDTSRCCDVCCRCVCSVCHEPLDLGSLQAARQQRHTRLRVVSVLTRPAFWSQAILQRLGFQDMEGLFASDLVAERVEMAQKIAKLGTTANGVERQPSDLRLEESVDEMVSFTSKWGCRQPHTDADTLVVFHEAACCRGSDACWARAAGDGRAGGRAQSPAELQRGALTMAMHAHTPPSIPLPTPRMRFLETLLLACVDTRPYSFFFLLDEPLRT